MAGELWTEQLSKYQPLARAPLKRAVKDLERNFPAVFPSLYPQAVCVGQRGEENHQRSEDVGAQLAGVEPMVWWHLAASCWPKALVSKPSEGR